MVLVLSMVNVHRWIYIQSLTSIHADGDVIADEFLICRLDGYGMVTAS